MKKSILLSVLASVLLTVSTFAQDNKLVSTKSQITFFSSTPAEDIQAHNTTSVSTINKETGEVIFSVPMQGFEFEKSLMQKHFNNDKFLDTKAHPKAKLKARITNIKEVDFSKDGTYSAMVEGELTIKGISKAIKEKGTITVKGNVVKVNSSFNITLADYGVTFTKGKPSKNIAKDVKVTVDAEY